MSSTILDQAKKAVEGKDIKIVFPEGTDKRILEAAIRHQEDGIIKPIVLGNKDEIQKTADENGLKINDLEIIDPANDSHFGEFVEKICRTQKR